MKKVISVFLIGCFCVLLLGGCGNQSKNLIGQWYNEKNRCLDIRSDGTWDLEDNYGTGTWKFLDDNTTVEFTDFYGDTQKSAIEENDLGLYIDFGYYGDFYKDGYPSQEEISKNKEKNAIEINPFVGMKYEVSGISPCCKIVINNEECEEAVQQYVEFELDKETYANGETATVKAILSENTGNEGYKLLAASKDITVTGQPEYVSSLNGVDTSELKKELSDFVNGNISGALKDAAESFWSEGTVLGNKINLYQGKITEYKYSDVYFSSLKRNKNLSYEDNYANVLTFVYYGSYTSANGNGNFYSCVSACNIIKYPDGTIKWGAESSDAKDFLVAPSSESTENAIDTIIMCNSSDYNISKVDFK